MGLLVILCLLVFAGCAGRTGGRTPFFHKKPTPGSVSLAALAQANPDWLLVRQTDNAIARYKSMLALPALAPAVPTVQLPPVPRAALPAQITTTTAQQVHIDRLGSSEIARLTASLQTAESERLSAQQKLADIRADQQLVSGRAQILARLLAVQRAILVGNEGEVVNLVIQIDALNDDAKRPATAPDDTWQKLAAAKEAELANLKASRAHQLDLAQAASDAELNALQAALRDQEAAEVAKTKAEIDRENAAEVLDQENRLNRQKAQIVAMTVSLQKEFEASIVSLAQAKPEAGIPLHGQAEAEEAASAETVVGQSLPAWRARLGNTIDELQRQRDRQAALVVEETRRAALGAARRDNLRITAWKQTGHGRDLTPVVLSELRRERWGEPLTGRAS